MDGATDNAVGPRDQIFEISCVTGSPASFRSHRYRRRQVKTEDIAEITDDGSRHARQPPSMARGERIGRYPDIGNSPDSADQVEEGKPAQQGQTAQSLVAISKLIIQEEIRSHRHQRGNTLYDSELEP